MYSGNNPTNSNHFKNWQVKLCLFKINSLNLHDKSDVLFSILSYASSTDQLRTFFSKSLDEGSYILSIEAFIDSKDIEFIHTKQQILIYNSKSFFKEIINVCITGPE
jgi:hypothetical protein